jgi:glycosyltransferase involved in cell wall biosynthesis
MYNKYMKILIATGIYPPDVGGPAKYAKNLADEFLRRGREVKVLAFRFERKLPIGVRHLFYFLRIILNIRKTDLIICLDMFSAGFPAVLAGKIFSKKTVLRVGGDFLWETYVESTGNLIKFKDFYKNRPVLPLKFKIIALLQKFALSNASALAFNTSWQKEFFEDVYGLDKKKTFVIENFYGEKMESREPQEKKFLFAGRKIKFKNLALLGDISEDLEIIDNLSAEESQEKIKNSYALIVSSISDFAPNFIIEGLSFNKPFILTKECGLAVKLADLGVFIDPFDKNSIKEAILFLKNEDNYDKYKKRIGSFTFTHSWKEIADEFLNI